jgi:LVIVD repeat
MGTDPNKKKRKKGKETLESKAQEPTEKQGGISRRALLKGTAAAAALQTLLQGTGAAVLATAGASLVAPEKAHAQEAGLMPEGGTVPFRLPMGALNYLDRKDYIHNMKIISYTPGVMAATAEPLLNMWAKGAQRVLPIAGGGFLDVSNPKKPEVIAKHSYNGFLTLVVYNTKLKKWILMSAASAPITSATPEYPHGQYDPEYRRKSIDYKGLRGIRTYDITDIEKPKLLQEFSTGATGNGTHMNFYDGGQYAFLDCGWDDQLRMENAQRAFSNGLMVVDMSDPANIKEVSRWWVPGQRFGEEEEYKKWIFANDQSSWTSAHGAPVVPKRIEDGGTIGYGGFGAFGMYVFDFSDIKHPKTIGRGYWEFEPMSDIPYHSLYPVITDEAHPKLKNIIFSTVECLYADGRAPYHTPHVIDVSDPRNPKIIGLFPRPKAPEGAPYTDFAFARGRFGSHNPQAWVAPGRMRPEIAGMAFFNAGCRLFDISEPTAPREVAWYVPPHSGEMDDYESWWRGTAETIFIEWDRNLIWLGCHAGTYCLSSPVLGEPVLEARKIERWTVPHINLGWDG